MNKLIYLGFILSLILSTPLLAMDEESRGEKTGIAPHPQPSKEPTESGNAETFSTKSNKVQIQQNPPLWLHITAERRDSYSAYGNAWVTLGSDPYARRCAVKSISLSLSFESKTEKTNLDSAEIEVSQRASKVCYNDASAYATTTGPQGSVYVSTH